MFPLLVAVHEASQGPQSTRFVWLAGTAPIVVQTCVPSGFHTQWMDEGSPHGVLQSKLWYVPATHWSPRTRAIAKSTAKRRVSSDPVFIFSDDLFVLATASPLRFPAEELPSLIGSYSRDFG